MRIPPPVSDGQATFHPLDTFTEEHIRSRYLSIECLFRIWQTEYEEDSGGPRDDERRVRSDRSDKTDAGNPMTSLKSGNKSLDVVCLMESMRCGMDDEDVARWRRRWRFRFDLPFRTQMMQPVSHSDLRVQFWMHTLSRFMDQEAGGDLLVDLPLNYRVYDRWLVEYPVPPIGYASGQYQPTKEDVHKIKIDRKLVVLGHPSGHAFTKPKDFAVHLRWLYRVSELAEVEGEEDELEECACPLCTLSTRCQIPLYRSGELLWLKRLDLVLPDRALDWLYAAGIAEWPVEILTYTEGRYSIALIDFPFELCGFKRQNAFQISLWAQHDLCPFQVHVPSVLSSPSAISGFIRNELLRSHLKNALAFCHWRNVSVSRLECGDVLLGTDRVASGDFILLDSVRLELKQRPNYPLLHVKAIHVADERVIFAGDLYQFEIKKQQFELVLPDWRIEHFSVQCRFHPNQFTPQQYDHESEMFDLSCRKLLPLDRHRMAYLLPKLHHFETKPSSYFGLHALIQKQLAQMYNMLEDYRVETIENVPELLPLYTAESTSSSSHEPSSKQSSPGTDGSTSSSQQSTKNKKMKLSELDQLLMNQRNYKDFRHLPSSSSRRRSNYEENVDVVIQTATRKSRTRPSYVTSSSASESELTQLDTENDDVSITSTIQASHRLPSSSYLTGTTTADVGSSSSSEEPDPSDDDDFQPTSNSQSGRRTRSKRQAPYFVPALTETRTRRRRTRI